MSETEPRLPVGWTVRMMSLFLLIGTGLGLLLGIGMVVSGHTTIDVIPLVAAGAVVGGAMLGGALGAIFLGLRFSYWLFKKPTFPRP